MPYMPYIRSSAPSAPLSSSEADATIPLLAPYLWSHTTGPGSNQAYFAEWANCPIYKIPACSLSLIIEVYTSDCSSRL